MSDLYVRKNLFPLSEDGPSFLRATPDEVLEAARNLPGAVERDLTITRVVGVSPGHYLVIPIPEKESNG